MSWNKNTIVTSTVDATVEILTDLSYPYNLQIKRLIQGIGINDLEVREYPLRRLQYGKWVILEKMIRHSDCDIDDTIVSYKLTLEDEPKNWNFVEEVYDN